MDGNITTAIYEINQLNMYVGVCVKETDVTLFVILNIFISNSNLIKNKFSVTVTDYNDYYFVIKLCDLYKLEFVQVHLNKLECRWKSSFISVIQLKLWNSCNK